MIKELEYILLIIVLIIGLFGLTGCGKNNEVVDSLNSAIDTIGKDGDYDVRTIQTTFEDNTKYKMIDANREEFTEIPSSSSSQFGSLQYAEQLINVGASYILIYDTETEEYYSVSVSYQSYKPVFTDATKIE